MLGEHFHYLQAVGMSEKSHHANYVTLNVFRLQMNIFGSQSSSTNSRFTGIIESEESLSSMRNLLGM